LWRLGLEKKSFFKKIYYSTFINLELDFVIF
jgi:hypothetical protein